MLHSMQRLLHSSDGFDSNLNDLRSCVQALQAPDAKITYPYKATAQAKFIAMSFCVRSLCSVQEDMKDEQRSELWHIMAKTAMMDSQVSHAVSIPFSVLDAARKSLALAAAQGIPSHLADCNMALTALKPLLRRCPASQGIKLCGAAVDSLVQLCTGTESDCSVALLKEVIYLMEFSLDILDSAQGVHGSRSWQSLTTTFFPSAVAAMWRLPCSPEMQESIRRASNTLSLSLQQIIGHPDHLRAASKEFQLMARFKSQERETDTAAAEEAQNKKPKQQKQNHANGVLEVWKLVQQLESGVLLSSQQAQTLQNIPNFSAWLIRTYHSSCERGLEALAPGSLAKSRNTKQATGPTDDSVRALPWHVLCVILQRGVDTLKQTCENPNSQRASCVALAACVEALQAAQECQAYRPTEDVGGKQLAVLTRIVQALQHAAGQLEVSGVRAAPVRQAMARVLSCIIALEHRCVSDCMEFVCSLIWGASDGDTGMAPATAAFPEQNGHESSSPTTTFRKHGCELLCSILEAFASLRRLDTLLPSILSYAVSAWTPGVDRTLRSLPAQEALQRAVNSAPSAQGPSLADALCTALELAAASHALQSLSSIASVSATVLRALRAEPQQAAAGAAAAQKVVSAAQALVDKIAAHAASEGGGSAACAEACLPLLQLQAGVLQFHGACTAHDPALDEGPLVIGFPATLLQHLPVAPVANLPDSYGDRCPDGLAEELTARAHREAAKLEGPHAQLYVMAVAGLGRVKDVAAGAGGMAARDAAAGGAACLAWLSTCLHDEHVRRAHSMSCATAHRTAAVPQELLLAASDAAGLGLLRGLHACGVAHPALQDESMVSEIQAEVVTPLLRCIAQWLPHADGEVQKAVIRLCLLASAEFSTAQRLGVAVSPASVMPLARVVCSDAVMSSKVASKAWPAAFASIARQLQRRLIAAVGTAVAAGCLPSCAAAEHILQQAPIVAKPCQDQGALLHLMQQTADLNDNYTAGQLDIAHMTSGSKRPRTTPQAGQKELMGVLCCIQALVALMEGMDIEMLAASSKNRKWGILARASTAIVSSMTAVCVLLQGTPTPAATKLRVDVLASPIKQLSAAVAHAQPGEDGWLVSAELMFMVSSCASADEWFGCQELQQASAELVQQVAAAALAQGKCQGLQIAWSSASSKLVSMLPEPLGISQSGVSRSGSEKDQGQSTAGTVPVRSTSKKRKRQLTDVGGTHKISRHSLTSLVLLSGVVTAALKHRHAGEQMNDGDGESVLFKSICDLSNDLDGLCSEHVSRLCTQAGGINSVKVLSLLFCLRAGSTCCDLAANDCPAAQQKVMACVRDCTSSVDVITSSERTAAAVSEAELGRLLLSLLQSVTTCFSTLNPQPADDIQAPILPIQMACLACMSSPICLTPRVEAHNELSLPVAHPLHQAASTLFMKSLSAIGSEATAVLMRRLLLWLGRNVSAASAALSSMLLLLECHKQPVLQRVQRMMPHLLRGVVQCLSSHPINPYKVSAPGATASMRHREVAAGNLSCGTDVYSVHLLAMRCLESMLGQKALFSNLGSEGTRIPLALVNISRDLAGCLDHDRDSDQLTVVQCSMMLLSGLCAATTAMLRHRDELAAIMWPLLMSPERLHILAKASAVSRSLHRERYHSALQMGSQAIASVYETVAGCESCEGCRHLLLKDYITVVSDAQYGQQAVGGLALPPASSDRLRQGAMQLVGVLSKGQLQHLHVLLERVTAGQDRLAALKDDYDRQQKFSGKV